MTTVYEVDVQLWPAAVRPTSKNSKSPALSPLCRLRPDHRVGCWSGRAAQCERASPSSSETKTPRLSRSPLAPIIAKQLKRVSVRNAPRRPANGSWWAFGVAGVSTHPDQTDERAPCLRLRRACNEVMRAHQVDTCFHLDRDFNFENQFPKMNATARLLPEHNSMRGGLAKSGEQYDISKMALNWNEPKIKGRLRV